MAGYFITGTDTGVGKTHVAVAIIKTLKGQGKTVAGMKPIAAGCDVTKQGLRNDDAILLQQASSIELPYEIVNPYAFQPAIAPHIAAQEAGVDIDIQHIKHYYGQIAAKVDTVIVEGAGGWLVPLNGSETMADIAAALQLPVILVVGMRLGCLNHALLTADSIQAKGAKLEGWVANQICGDMESLEDNIESLRRRLKSPLFANIPYGKTTEFLQSFIYVKF